MADVAVDVEGWIQLDDELGRIREDARAVNSFMEQRVNTQWEVCSVGLIAEIALIYVVVQRNGAPVWLIRAAWCENNVLQWLARNGILPPAVNSVVWHSGE
jgi:hypothetical protein